MPTSKIINKLQNSNGKPGPKVTLPIVKHTSEEILDTLTDIIIERILEERNKKIIV